jgi:hypothetical protein
MKSLIKGYGREKRLGYIGLEHCPTLQSAAQTRYMYVCVYIYIYIYKYR